MSRHFDIKLTAEFDLAIANGDFELCENLNQQVGCLLAANAGDYRQNPTIGIGLQDYLLDERLDDLKRVMRLNFVKEGLAINRLNIANGEIMIDVTRKN